MGYLLIATRAWHGSLQAAYPASDCSATFTTIAFDVA